MQISPSRPLLRVYGLVGVLAVAGLVALALASYQQKFTPVVNVTLQSERSGLLLDPGADVRARGILIGEVRAVRPGPEGGAELELALDVDQAKRIPSGTTAEMLTTTPFGAKYVSLDVPDGVIGEPITDGEVLRTRHVTSEANDVFAGVHRLLTEVDAAKLNETLAAMASALDGRGSKLGDYIVDLNRYLVRLNGHLPSLAADIDLAGGVVDTYAKAAPDFLRVADNASTTSITLGKQAAALHGFLLGLTDTALDGTEFLDQLEEPLVTALDVLAPSTRLLAQYSPVLTCSIQGLNGYREMVESILGNQLPGIQGLVTLLPGQQGYQHPRDLPKLVTGDGPDCFSLPHLAEGEQSPHHHFDDGTHVFDGDGDAITVGNPPVSLYTQLFGLPDAGAGR